VNPEHLHLEGVEHREVDAGGLRMHVAEIGEGPPLVLLHGWPQHWWMWREVLPTLSRTYRCIAPDLRGLGWTEAPPDGYDKPQLAADVLALLDALGLDTVRLIGHDWGAVATQIICAEAPERVSKALVLSVPSLFERRADPRQLLGLAHMPFLSAPFGHLAVPTVAKQVFRLSGFTDADAEPYLERLRRPERAKATVRYYRTFLTREFPASIARPRERPDVPMRFVAGAGDPVARYAPGVELVRGARHFLPEDKPDAVIGHAMSFL
jgi:pimeloyl-ACP methyl ester carboxylesterase